MSAKFTTILLSLLLLSGCYVTRLAYTQVYLLATSTKVAEVISNGDISNDERTKLEKVMHIIAYAAQQGLNTKGAYESYIAIDGDAVSYTVFAAPSDSLQLIKWWYPIVGSVPYRGYFDKQRRDAKAEALKSKGYDVSKASVDAYSSLGWFADPIYSPMLKRKLWSLADLFFHELTHRTYWAKNSSEFNESIAEFVAYKLTSEYLQINKHQAELQSFHNYWHDRKKYVVWLRELRQNLKELFKTADAIGADEFQARKQQVYKRAVAQQPDFEQYNFVGKLERWNNARVAVASMYYFDYPKYNQIYECLDSKHNFADMEAFLSYLKSIKSISDAKFLALC
ncbi:MAG: aminopeptidase [Pseudomonadota bacterium]|nr:aminopeptidase [Pseudomonadota bacterium]